MSIINFDTFCRRNGIKISPSFYKSGKLSIGVGFVRGTMKQHKYKEYLISVYMIDHMSRVNVRKEIIRFAAIKGFFEKSNEIVYYSQIRMGADCQFRTDIHIFHKEKK